MLSKGGILGSTAQYNINNLSGVYSINEVNNKRSIGQWPMEFSVGTYTNSSLGFWRGKTKSGIGSGTTTGIFVKPDGTSVYATSGTSTLIQYNLSTAYDITTAGGSVGTISLGVSTADDLYISPDGTKVYVIVGSTTDQLRLYTLSTPWLLSSSSLTTTISISSFDTDAAGIFFKPDGTKMYLCGATNDRIMEFDMSTAWDITTFTGGTFSKTFSISAKETVVTALQLSNDGTKMYVLGTTSDALHQYNLSTAWDISTSVFSGTMFPSQETGRISILNPEAFCIADNGLDFYIMYAAVAYQFRAKTAWNLSDVYTTYTGVSTSANDSIPNGLQFRPDGGKMYTSGSGSDNIQEYYLSTPWLVTTKTLLNSFSVPANPEGLYINPMGDKLFTINSSVITSYNLSKIWDLSSVSNQIASVSITSKGGYGLTFSPDGLNFYSSSSTYVLYQNKLITPWDITTIYSTINTSVYFNNYLSVLEGIQFSPDGLSLYTVSSDTSAVGKYTLSTPFDISTITGLDGIMYVEDVETVANALHVKYDGTKIFISGQTTDSIHEYTVNI